MIDVFILDQCSVHYQQSFVLHWIIFYHSLRHGCCASVWQCSCHERSLGTHNPAHPPIVNISRLVSVVYWGSLEVAPTTVFVGAVLPTCIRINNIGFMVAAMRGGAPAFWVSW